MDRTILIVDDEADIRDILQFNLENAGFKVDTASSAEQALEILSDRHSLILLDVMMGGISGFKMAETLRGWGNDVPIIFLTAKDRQDDLLTGFSAGADDYISKPFSIQEVIARVNAVLKRFELRKPQSAPASDHIQVGKVSIDVQKKTVTVDGEPVAFSKKEFEILNLLASNPGKIFSREDLHRHGLAKSPSDLRAHRVPCRLNRGKGRTRRPRIFIISVRCNVIDHVRVHAFL